MLDYTAIGRKIRYLRTSSDMTQETFAEKLEVTPDYISKIENGSKHPSLKILDTIADIFKLDVCDLLKGTDPASRDYGFPELFTVIENWEPETRVLLLRTADTFASIDREIKAAKG